MDWDRVAGNWKQFVGLIKERWGELTDDDLTVINGRRDQLEGKIFRNVMVAPKIKRAAQSAIGSIKYSPLNPLGSGGIQNRMPFRIVRILSSATSPGC